MLCIYTVATVLPD